MSLRAICAPVLLAMMVLTPSGFAGEKQAKKKKPAVCDDLKFISKAALAAAQVNEWANYLDLLEEARENEEEAREYFGPVAHDDTDAELRDPESMCMGQKGKELKACKEDLENFDYYSVSMGVDEECYTAYEVKVRKGTCELVATPEEIDGERDCG
jgi:hypothetical protein